MDADFREKPASPGHETTDAEVKPILKFLIGLFVLIFVAMVGMSFLFDFFQQHFQGKAGPSTSLVDSKQIPPGPKLQPDPAKELSELRALEEKELNSYQWVDRDTGVFRIPINRAIELLAQSPPASRKQNPEPGGQK